MLKLVIDKLDDVEEKYRELYEEKDGAFHLNVDGAGDDLSGLKNKVKELLDEKKRAVEEKRNLEQKLALEAAKNEEERIKLLEQQGKHEEAAAAREVEFKRRVEAAEKKAAESVEKMKRTLIDIEVTRLAADLAGDAAFILEPHLRERFSAEEKDGEIVVVAKDKDGNEIGIDKLADEYRGSEQWNKVIVGRDSSGGGAPTGGSGGADDWDAVFNPVNELYSPTKQAELEKINVDKYKALVKKYNLDDPVAAAAPQPVQIRR